MWREGRHHVAGERIPGSVLAQRQGIVDDPVVLAKVPLLHPRGGDGLRDRGRVHLPAEFHALEEEQSLPRSRQRTAERSAELVEAEGRPVPPVRVREPVVGLELVIADEFVQHAVELAPSGAGDHVDDGARCPPVLRGERVRLHLELLQRVG